MAPAARHDGRSQTELQASCAQWREQQRQHSSAWATQSSKGPEERPAWRRKERVKGHVGKRREGKDRKEFKETNTKKAKIETKERTLQEKNGCTLQKD